MKNYQHILCATDFSYYSQAAAERALELARLCGARITLLHVVENFPEDRSNELIAPEDMDPASYREQKARDSLDSLAHTLSADQIEKQVRISSHSAAHEIVQFAEKNKVDLVVVATHGHRGITVMLGSTANGIAHRASCDVLVVRAHEIQ